MTSEQDKRDERPSAPDDRADEQQPADDETCTKEKIEQTGEPERDALGNQSGSS
jgi:hypothetical protein